MVVGFIEAGNARGRKVYRRAHDFNFGYVELSAL